MTWIEQLWGIAPDGGSGATEFLIFASAALAVTAALYRHFAVRRVRR